MGMAVGGKGGPQANINMTPLIDVLLVLLIIFMVITPLTPKGLEALVPQPPPPNAPPPDPSQDHTVSATFQTGYRFKGSLVRPARVQVYSEGQA